ncbi:MAG TPA: UDP-glucose/GDP-mannose dehydrogenase family protein [Dehalococcoidia bacterium]|nr:UDP-glucose/GDP-mannose dehydrogenase family protein [Dehalococcoidia bacterium]
MSESPPPISVQKARLAVIGAGYVGLVVAAVFAKWGHHVTCFEKSPKRLRQLQAGGCPIYEPGLPELLREGVASARLTFARGVDVRDHQFVFVCVGTPSNQGGAAKLDQVFEAASAIGRTLRPGAMVVLKSTVPVGTCERVEQRVREAAGGGVPFAVVSNPEFLREGSAVHDAEWPDRVVVGAKDAAAARRVAQLYEHQAVPIVACDIRTAELIKYAANAFLATKISFINEMANIAEAVGGDVAAVATGIGLDHRIGREFLKAGLGYGGSCFPKDVQALNHMSRSNGYRFRLLEAVMSVNRQQRKRLVQKVERVLGTLEGAELGVLGLSFKPNTDDIRKSVSIALIRQLGRAGAWVRAYDPVAMPQAERALGGSVRLCLNPYDAAAGADGLILVTEWDEFRNLDYSRVRELVRQPHIFDGRNFLDREYLQGLGFAYHGVGR